MILRLAASAMGTRFELALDGEREVALRAAGEEAIAEILAWDRRLSAFRPDSVTSQLSREASEAPVRVDDQTFALLELCADVWRASGGAFDPTIGPLMEAWRFRDEDRAEPGHDRTACERRAASVMHRVGFARVELDAGDRTVRFSARGMCLDFGGVGKGWALDRGAELLRDAGVSCALLHGGTSSVVAIGAPPGHAGFRVALAPPASDALPPIDLRDESLGVSAPHGRSWNDRNNTTVGHVIDPRTGQPCRAARLAAVRGPSAASCDAWSTAALVLGGRPDGMPHAYQLAALTNR